MVDSVSKEKRSKIMAAIHSKNTAPELTLRRALWKKGYRYRVNYGNEKIDVAFPLKKIAIFVDGCFWHSCPIHSHLPKSNQEYWIPKLERNRKRDKVNTEKLEKEGWKVIRFWEHEMDNLDKLIEQVKKWL